VRGRAALDFRWKGFNLRPELVLARPQNSVFPTETPTAGYGLFNLGGGYTIARAHVMHQFSGLWFNAGDRLYRNHLSFIKDFVPEIGRGIRFSYTLRWF
jgi:iron complex outermembrane receptor protein